VEDLTKYITKMNKDYNHLSCEDDGILKNQHRTLTNAIMIENNKVRVNNTSRKRGYVKYSDCVVTAQELGVNFVWAKEGKGIPPVFEEVSSAVAKRHMLTALKKYVNRMRDLKGKYTYECLKSQYSIARMHEFLCEHNQDKTIEDVVDMDRMMSDPNFKKYSGNKTKTARNLLNLIWVCEIFNPFLPAKYASKASKLDLEDWAGLDGLLINP